MQGRMSANQDPPLTPEIREEIEDAQYEIHRSFWDQLLPFCLDRLTLATSFLGPSEPPRPKRRIKVLAILNLYGIQLFNCEHKYYPQAEELPLWRSALAPKIVEMVMAQVDLIEHGLRSLQFHVPSDEMRHSISEALKGYIGKLPLPVARLQIHESEAEPRLPIENVMPEASSRTTDGFPPYPSAVAYQFGSHINFATLVKIYRSPREGDQRYSPGEVTECIPTPLIGNPDPARICTSHIERQNLTMRMSMRRLTRLTNAFSKKWENLNAALALHFAYYNFCRVHKTLRVTPAMQAGISDHIWTISDLLNAG
jgi:hypothetical protein